jgi:hypothetical protein
MIEFRVNDRVELISCAGAPGIVTGVARGGKVMVRLDDFDGATWVLRASSLRLIPTTMEQVTR